MTKKHPAILRAEKLRALVSMPEFSMVKEWLDEAQKKALFDLTSAKEPNAFLPAQGAYQAISDINGNFDRVWRDEARALKELTKLEE